jgi:hypothetical protein
MCSSFGWTPLARPSNNVPRDSVESRDKLQDLSCHRMFEGGDSAKHWLSSWAPGAFSAQD